MPAAIPATIVVGGDRTAVSWHHEAGAACLRTAILDRQPAALADAGIHAVLLVARLSGAGGAPRAGTVYDLGQLDSNGMLLMNVNPPDDHRQAERRLRTRS